MGISLNRLTTVWRRTRINRAAHTERYEYKKLVMLVMVTKLLNMPQALTIIFCIPLSLILFDPVAADSYKEEYRENVESLTNILGGHGIRVDEQIGYHNLVETLKNEQINATTEQKQKVTVYLESSKGLELITAQTSKPGLLNWYFIDSWFLKNDLIFASYEDGEMNGGDILIKVVWSGNRILKMENLWEFH